MLNENRFAFKEWASVCAALAAGRQSLILRKGGLHEGREGFRVDHREFWLLPTAFHQQPDALIEEARSFHEQALRDRPADGTIVLQNYAVAEAVHHLQDVSLLPRLAGQHVWSERTVHERFHYREPALFALVVRIHRSENPIVLPDSPHFAGCRSWADLPSEVSTQRLRPILSDADHARAVARIERALARREFV